jgi:hypothetical protein
MPKKKKSGSAKGPKLPREIAGIKISKELRSAIEPVMRFANHPLVSDTLAAALLAGASALGGKKGASAAKASADATAGVIDAASDAGKAAVDAATGANRVGLALAVAAGEIASRIVTSYDFGGVAAARKAAKPKAAKAKTGRPKAKVGGRAKAAGPKARKPVKVVKAGTRKKS